MHLHDVWISAPKRRLDRIATQLAEGCLPWILSQIVSRMGVEGPQASRGYARAWAGLAILEIATADRLAGVDEVSREEVVARAVEKAADEVLRWVPARACRPLRKAA